MLGYVGIMETGVEMKVFGIWLNKETAIQEMIKQINYMIDNLVDYSDKENFYKIKDRKIKYFKQDNSVIDIIIYHL